MAESGLGQALRYYFAELRQIFPDLLLLLAFALLYLSFGVLIVLSLIGATTLIRGG